MLNNEPSFASLLVRQSPAMHYGHGWIHLPGGKKWHPCIELSPRQQAVRGICKKRLLQHLSFNAAGNLQTRRKVFPES
ncbi:phage filamentation protein Fil family protein [Klebsiella pneumoniae]|uniref:phage filamentation protein Fil family protein n=1 Tax=Klebsiella pneumoniae TaxID=573 RepID=UPI00404563E3